MEIAKLKVLLASLFLLNSILGDSNEPNGTHPEDDIIPIPRFVPKEKPNFDKIGFSLILILIRKYMIEVNCWKSCHRWLLDELNGDEKSPNERFADPCECKKPLDHYGDDCFSATWMLRLMSGSFSSEPTDLPGVSWLGPGDTRYIEMLKAKNISFSNFFFEMRRYMVAAGGWEKCQDAIAHLSETDLSATLSPKDCTCRLLGQGKESRFLYDLYLLGATMCYRL
ncbi:unnamed protein product, partial [Mesorhabditis belari]|uniref:Uncharacterized protein n=1 Tax=Mesorhabditis belari TaxID=2138241 RepID=A0AAF3FAN2_9BILA